MSCTETTGRCSRLRMTKKNGRTQNAGLAEQKPLQLVLFHSGGTHFDSCTKMVSGDAVNRGACDSGTHPPSGAEAHRKCPSPCSGQFADADAARQERAHRQEAVRHQQEEMLEEYRAKHRKQHRATGAPSSAADADTTSVHAEHCCCSCDAVGVCGGRGGGCGVIRGHASLPPSRVTPPCQVRRVGCPPDWLPPHAFGPGGHSPGVWFEKCLEERVQKRTSSKPSCFLPCFARRHDSEQRHTVMQTTLRVWASSPEGLHHQIRGVIGNPSFWK